MYNKNQRYWLVCPRCGNKLMLMLKNTVVQNFPMHCRKCKLDAILNINEHHARAEEPVLSSLGERKPELKSQCHS